jgi:hypothetical protein
MEVFSMANIEKGKLSNGKYSYRVRIRLEGAPPKTETYPTKAEALDFARRMEAEIRAGRYFGREEEKERTVGEFIRLLSKFSRIAPNCVSQRLS